MLRYPLTRVLGVDANVSVLRELFVHGGELSAPARVVRSGLAQSSVRWALIDQEAMKIVEATGSGRTRLFRIGNRHPLAAAIGALFQTEDHRFEGVLTADAPCRGAVRAGGGRGLALRQLGEEPERRRKRCGFAVVVETDALRRVEDAMRDELSGSGRELAFAASVLAVDVADGAQLAETKDPCGRRWRGAPYRSSVTGRTPPGTTATRPEEQAEDIVLDTGGPPRDPGRRHRLLAQMIEFAAWAESELTR